MFWVPLVKNLRTIFCVSMLLATQVASGEVIKKEEDGVAVTIEREIKSLGGGGTVYSKETREFLTVEAAERFTKEYKDVSYYQGAALCGLATMHLVNPVAALLASVTCGVITKDDRPIVRRGDVFVKETFGAVAGGVGGTTRYREIAFGERHGKKAVLWFIHSSTDSKAAEWAKEILEGN